MTKGISNGVKRVLVTGGAGFIGANVVRAFLGQEKEVHVLEYPGCNLWRLDEIKEKISIHAVDIAHYEELESYIQSIKPRLILHFASYGAYQGTQRDIQKTIDTNLLGTINLVRACERAGFEAFLHTGSSSEYGVKEKPMKESDVLQAHNLYGMTKAAATLYCQAAARKQGLPIAVMRPFAVYGPFEEQTRLIPTLVMSYLRGESPKLSSSSSVRDFVFVEDLIAAYQAGIEHIQEVKGEIFNVGTGAEHTVQEAAEAVKRIVGSELEPQYGQVKPNQEEPKHWVADISKTKGLLRWQPQHTLGEGLGKTLEWFRELEHKKFYGYDIPL